MLTGQDFIGIDIALGLCAAADGRWRTKPLPAMVSRATARQAVRLHGGARAAMQAENDVLARSVPL